MQYAQQLSERLRWEMIKSKNTNKKAHLIIFIIDANELNVRAPERTAQSAKFYLLFFTFFQFSNSLFYLHFTRVSGVFV